MANRHTKFLIGAAFAGMGVMAIFDAASEKAPAPQPQQAVAGMGGVGNGAGAGGETLDYETYFAFEAGSFAGENTGAAGAPSAGGYSF